MTVIVAKGNASINKHASVAHSQRFSSLRQTYVRIVSFLRPLRTLLLCKVSTAAVQSQQSQHMPEEGGIYRGLGGERRAFHMNDWLYTCLSNGSGCPPALSSQKPPLDLDRGCRRLLRSWPSAPRLAAGSPGYSSSSTTRSSPEIFTPSFAMSMRLRSAS
jgi:hypothetical protein